MFVYGKRWKLWLTRPEAIKPFGVELQKQRRLLRPSQPDGARPWRLTSTTARHNQVTGRTSLRTFGKIFSLSRRDEPIKMTDVWICILRFAGEKMGNLLKENRQIFYWWREITNSRFQKDITTSVRSVVQLKESGDHAKKIQANPCEKRSFSERNVGTKLLSVAVHLSPAVRRQTSIREIVSTSLL